VLSPLWKVEPSPPPDPTWKAHMVSDSPHSLLSKCTCMGVYWVFICYLSPSLIPQKEHTTETFSLPGPYSHFVFNYNQTLSPTLNELVISKSHIWLTGMSTTQLTNVEIQLISWPIVSRCKLTSWPTKSRRNVMNHQCFMFQHSPPSTHVSRDLGGEITSSWNPPIITASWSPSIIRILINIDSTKCLVKI